MILLVGCGAKTADDGPEPAPVMEYRCVKTDGGWGGLECGDGRDACRCPVGEGRLTRIAACRVGEHSSDTWHSPLDAARGRAARDGSLVGEGDDTGAYCLPAPPR